MATLSASAQVMSIDGQWRTADLPSRSSPARGVVPQDQRAAPKKWPWSAMAMSSLCVCRSRVSSFEALREPDAVRARSVGDRARVEQARVARLVTVDLRALVGRIVDEQVEGPG